MFRWWPLRLAPAWLSCVAPLALAACADEGPDPGVGGSAATGGGGASTATGGTAGSGATTGGAAGAGAQGGAASEQFFFPPAGEGIDSQDQRAPAEVGLSSDVVGALGGFASRWALWRHGYLVHVDGDFNEIVEVKSLRKTWHAMTVGAAIQQGRIPSTDQLVDTWLQSLTGNDALASFWHVITQSAGFDYPYGSYPDYLPGEMWTYSDLNLMNLCNAIAKAWGKVDYDDNYDEVLRSAYFDAIGMQGWSSSTQPDGVRLHLDLEDMGRLGLLALARGRWEGTVLVPATFVVDLETKQTHGMLVNYDGPNDGQIGLDPLDFPEAPYGFLTWTNSNGDYYPAADTAWAWGAGAGGTRIMWNHNNGIVYAAVGLSEGSAPITDGVADRIEANVTGPNPLAQP